MGEWSSLGLLAAASLVVAALHVLYSFVINTLTRTEMAGLNAQREVMRLARGRQTEAEQVIVDQRGRLDDLQLSITQLERRFDRETDDKLRFEIVVGRPGPGLVPFRGRIDRRGVHGRGRDSIVWDRTVMGIVWAGNIERARSILADAYPRSRGCATAIDMPLAEGVHVDFDMETADAAADLRTA